MRSASALLCRVHSFFLWCSVIQLSLVHCWVGDMTKKPEHTVYVRDLIHVSHNKHGYMKYFIGAVL